MHSRRHLSEQELTRKAICGIPENRLTRRAKQVHDGIIAIPASVHATPDHGPVDLTARNPLINI